MNIRPRILIVDTDIVDVCESVNALSGAFEVYLTGNYGHVIDELQRFKIHLILFKIQTDILDQFLNLITLIRSDCHLGEMPVLISLSKYDKSVIMRCINAGVHDYLVNTSDIDLFAKKAYNLVSYYWGVQNKVFTINRTHKLLLNKGNLFSEFEKEVANIIDNDLDYNVKSIAEQLSTSIATLERVVKRVTQMTPNKYIIKRRLEKANYLIASKQFNLKEVAFMAGFSSPSHFSRTYKQHFGTPPTEVVETFL